MRKRSLARYLELVLGCASLGTVIAGTVVMPSGSGWERAVTLPEEANWLAFAPGGDVVATAGGDSVVRLWNLANGAVTRELVGHQDKVTNVTFSEDGRLVLSGSMDGAAVLWSAVSGELLTRFGGHESNVFALLSADAAQVATTCGVVGAPVRVWDTATGRRILELRHPEQDRWRRYQATDVAFSHDGDHLAVAYFYDVVLYAAETGLVESVMVGHTGIVDCVGFSPDSTLLVSGSDDGTARVWSVQTGLKRLVLRGHLEGVRSAEFSPSGERILTASSDGTVRVWRVRDGRCLAVLGEGRRPQNENWGLSARYDREGASIFAMNEFRSIWVYDAGSFRETGRVPRGFRSSFVSADGHWIGVVSYEDVELWRRMDPSENPSMVPSLVLYGTAVLLLIGLAMVWVWRGRARGHPGDTH